MLFMFGWQIVCSILVVLLSFFFATTAGIAPVIQSSSEVIESFDEDTPLVVTIGTRLKVLQGKLVQLVCPVSGFPSPKVDWTKGNVLIDEQPERQGVVIFPYNGTSSTLFIRASQQSPRDVVFGCTAYNSGGSATVFSYVTFYGSCRLGCMHVCYP